MASTIEYNEAIAECSCGEKVEVIVVREQDNRTGEISLCLNRSYKCPECGEKITLSEVED